MSAAKKSKERVKEQLGMSYGAARSRLWTQLLFRMAHELGRDTCFRCGTLIETIDEFSVDHKEPWLDVSVALFWDLDNVAFSHLSCNVRAARRNPVNNREALRRYWETTNQAPEGKSWCFGCKAFLEKEKFNANKHRFSGVQKYCKECRSKDVGRSSKWRSKMPGLQQMQQLLEQHDYRGVGKVLGVSHMAIAVWAKELGLQGVRQKARVA